MIEQDNRQQEMGFSGDMKHRCVDLIREVAFCNINTRSLSFRSEKYITYLMPLNISETLKFNFGCFEGILC